MKTYWLEGHQHTDIDETTDADMCNLLEEHDAVDGGVELATDSTERPESTKGSQA